MIIFVYFATNVIFIDACTLAVGPYVEANANKSTENLRKFGTMVFASNDTIPRERKPNTYDRTYLWSMAYLIERIIVRDRREREGGERVIEIER